MEYTGTTFTIYPYSLCSFMINICGREGRNMLFGGLYEDSFDDINIGTLFYNFCNQDRKPIPNCKTFLNF